MKTVNWDSGVRWDDPNFYWGEPAYLLEPGDPGYVPPVSTRPKKPKKKRKYMASNPTPTRLDELLAAGEDLCDGLNQHAAAIGVDSPRSQVASGVKTGGNGGNRDKLNSSLSVISVASCSKSIVFTQSRNLGTRGHFVRIGSR